jgi:hypothetical protein
LKNRKYINIFVEKHNDCKNKIDLLRLKTLL